MISLMGVSKAVEVLRDFGIILEKRNGNGKQSYTLTPAQIGASIYLAH
jgi:hypothetical protein